MQQGHQILLEKNGEIGKMQSYYEGILNQMQGKYNDLQKMLNTKTREAEALSRNCEEMTLKYQALASKQNMQSNLEVKFKEDIARLAALN